MFYFICRIYRETWGVLIACVVKFVYNETRGKFMLESFSDYISTGILLILVSGAFYLVLRMFLHHRRQRLIEEEIEYYQEW